jgi:rare lipoprotein A
MRLDMIGDGTSMVEVTAINLDQSAQDRPVRRATPPTPGEAGSGSVHTHAIFVQVGAFGERANAERRLGELSLAGIKDAFIHEESLSGRTLYRVRIGPVADVVQYDVLVEELENIGITDPYLITD